VSDPRPTPEPAPGEPLPDERADASAHRIADGPADTFAVTSADVGGADPIAERAPTRLTGRGVVLRVVLALVLGMFVAALGTATHRTVWNDLPAGLVLALALTASTAVLCRAWAGLATLAGAAAGWIIAVEVLSLTASGGDVLVVDPAASIRFAQASVVWSWGGVAVLGAVAFLPRRWFARR
jgi:hypothetical protein